MHARAANDQNFYTHPTLYRINDPIKGTGVASEDEIKQGTLVFLDNPYALVPTVEYDSQILPPCSSVQCSQVVHDNKSRVTCSENCTSDVVWCNSECQRLGSAMHQIECAWLTKFAKEIREQFSDGYFWSLWLIVRVLAQQQVDSLREEGWTLANAGNKTDRDSAADRQLDNTPSDTWQRTSKLTSNGTSTSGTDDLSCTDLDINERFPSNGTVVMMIRSNEASLQSQKLSFWRLLISKYLSSGDHTGLSHVLSDGELLTLFCRVETNHYDLWPQLIGLWPLKSLPVNRTKSCYAYAMYLRILLVNHSCQPNLMHQPDSNGRMMFVANQDIAANEELTVAYFDLADPVYADVKQRRAYLEDEFRFTCACPRCTEESGDNNGSGLTDVWPGLAVVGDTS